MLAQSHPSACFPPTPLGTRAMSGQFQSHFLLALGQLLLLQKSWTYLQEPPECAWGGMGARLRFLSVLRAKHDDQSRDLVTPGRTPSNFFRLILELSASWTNQSTSEPAGSRRDEKRDQFPSPFCLASGVVRPIRLCPWKPTWTERRPRSRPGDQLLARLGTQRRHLPFLGLLGYLAQRRTQSLSRPEGRWRCTSLRPRATRLRAQDPTQHAAPTAPRVPGARKGRSLRK